MKIIIRTKKPEAITTLTLCIGPTKRAFYAIRDSHGLKLPEELILRPVKEYKEALKRRLTFGRGGIGSDGKYFVALNTRCYKSLNPSCLDTIAHEAAHVAELILYNQLTHGREFDALYETAKEAICLK
ncbi:MAG: SprT-like domain-containing protein [Alphaproteobacteria bacterium]|uniref:SprT-like domain-containing protein n=1 Tax=Candidatus Nitrobium versatile TaxID=2884831 RepID=A0A953JE66_9BACT|nr:SprT-like domain-containing protein [Candidatus Nitrobium versatile]